MSEQTKVNGVLAAVSVACWTGCYFTLAVCPLASLGLMAVGAVLALAVMAS